MEPRVTRVRYEGQAGRALLQTYLFGGTYGPVRPPRGIAPEEVLDFLRKQVLADAEPDVFRKALDLLRFYELPEALAALVPALEKLRNAQDLLRSAFVLQAVGDLGTSTEADHAATHLDTRLVPCPDASLEFPALLDTRLALAPHGTDAALAARIHVEVQRAQADAHRDEQAMMHADALSAVERNDLPRIRVFAAAKGKLAALDAAAREQALVATYLGRSAATGPYLEVWAARMLRRSVFTGALAPVVEVLGKVIVEADPVQQGTLADFAVVRAAQAIVYLGGELRPEWAQAYETSLPTGASLNFLWDDP
jgi:hypothetical protein